MIAGTTGYGYCYWGDLTDLGFVVFPCYSKSVLVSANLDLPEVQL